MTQSCEHTPPDKYTPQSLGDELWRNELEAGVVHLHGLITEYQVTELVREVNFAGASVMLTEHPERCVRLLINSPGGSVSDALAMYDFLMDFQKHRIPIRGIVQGLAASAAAMIVLQATSDRLATPHSRFLLHEPSRWTLFSVESATALQDQATEMKRLADIVIDILARRTGCPAERIRDLISRKEVWLSAQEALEWGLIDAIA